MPELSRFFGIVIAMYFRDHVPPHFHARYGEHEAKFAVAVCLAGHACLCKNGIDFTSRN
jgi:hypothetical protein